MWAKEINEMLDAILKILDSILNILLLPIALLYSWIIRPFLEITSEDGLITAILVFVGCALPTFLFIRWRVKLHQRKKYWQERIYQEEPLTINEVEQMKAETNDALANFLSNFYIRW